MEQTAGRVERQQITHVELIFENWGNWCENEGGKVLKKKKR